MFTSFGARKVFTQSIITLTLMLVGSVAAQAASVGFSPDNTTVVNGATFSMDLVGTGFNSGDLDGGGINFTYDASVVQVTSITVDTVIWEFFSDDGMIDNVLGSGIEIQFNSFQSRTGDLFFATVEFIAVDVGTSLLGLAEFGGNPFATGGQLYPGLAFAQSGSITVSAVPVPAAAWLFASALGFAGWLRRRV